MPPRRILRRYLLSKMVRKTRRPLKMRIATRYSSRKRIVPSLPHPKYRKQSKAAIKRDFKRMFRRVAKGRRRRRRRKK
jgi:hypothetical protein